MLDRVLNAALNVLVLSPTECCKPKLQRKIPQVLRNQNKDITIFFGPVFRNYFLIFLCDCLLLDWV